MKARIPRALDGERVDRAVAVLCGLSRSEVAQLVSRGAVSVGGRPATAASRRVAEGEELDVELGERRPTDGAPTPEPDVAVPVVHVDADVIVVDKPAGLVVHPGAGRDHGTLVNGLLARFPELAGVGDVTRPGIVHRLDVGTSGLMVVARQAAAYRSLVDQLGARTVERRYLALVWGHFESRRGLIDAPVGRGTGNRTTMAVTTGGRQARTRYQVLAERDDPCVSLLECRLETGRTHQVRVHLAVVGHPVVGDTRYRGARPTLPLDRPFLHAHRLAFDHPTSGQHLRFDSRLPAELASVCSTMGGVEVDQLVQEAYRPPSGP